MDNFLEAVYSDRNTNACAARKYSKFGHFRILLFIILRLMDFILLDNVSYDAQECVNYKICNV